MHYERVVREDAALSYRWASAPPLDYDERSRILQTWLDDLTATRAEMEAICLGESLERPKGLGP